MVAQKGKKNCQQKFFAFLNTYYPKTHLITSLNSLDSSQLNMKLSKIQKREVLGNYFCLKMISKLALQ